MQAQSEKSINKDQNVFEIETSYRREFLINYYSSRIEDLTKNNSYEDFNKSKTLDSKSKDG